MPATPDTSEDHSNKRNSRKKAQRNTLYWAVAWALSLIGSAATIRWILADDNRLAILLTALWPIAVSFGALRSYLASFKNLDELSQRIELESLAAGFGAGIVVGIAYLSLENADVVPAFYLSPTLAMFFVKIVVQIHATRKYT